MVNFLPFKEIRDSYISAKSMLAKIMIVSLLLGAFGALSAQQTDQIDKSDREYLRTLFDIQPNTPEISPAPNSNICSPQCRKLSDEAVRRGYRTVIVDFDAQSGITTCDIKYPHGGKTAFTASTINNKCISETNKVFTEADLSTLNVPEGENFEAGITYAEQTGDYLTMSRFISALLTLDPEVIDFNSTATSGILRLKGQLSLYQVSHNLSTGNGNLSASARQIANQNIQKSVAENFNKANLAYYSRLFTNMGSIYGYLQNLLFVFMGMFFLGKVGFDKGMRALDKSKSAQDDTQWMSRFYVPLVTVGFFFAPMPEDAGLNATIVQKMIRFMVTESTIVADKASAVAVDAYVQRLYATVGTMGAKAEQQIRSELHIANKSIPLYNNAVNGVCKTRFPAVSSFLGASKRDVERLDTNNVTTTGSGKQDIEFDACKLIEYRMRVQEKVRDDNSLYLDSIKKAYDNKKLKETIGRVNDHLQQQQNQLGWTNAIIIPSASMLIESMSIVQDNSIQNRTSSSFSNTISRSMNASKLNELNELLKENRQKSESPNDEDLGVLVAKYAYMAMPGASGLYRAFEKNHEEAWIVANALKEESISKENIETSTYADSDKTYILAVSKMYEWFLAKLPIAVSVIAGIIAFVGYIIELAKYYYISPFVVAFALTTKKTHKIVDFLVTGLTIFFKPILLVVFIALAVFIYTLVQDIFIFYTKAEFEVLGQIAGESTPTQLVISLLSILIQTLGSLGATYIMWKLILTGPTWAMKLVGVDNAQNDMISEALSQRMDRAGFNM